MDSTMTSDIDLDESRTDQRNNQNRLLQLPMSRIRTIMKSSPELGNVSQEAYFLITKATECFVQYMAEEAWKAASDKKLVQYKQLGEKVFLMHNVLELNVFPISSFGTPFRKSINKPSRP